MFQNMEIQEITHISRHQVLHLKYIQFLLILPQKMENRKLKRTNQETALSLPFQKNKSQPSTPHPASQAGVLRLVPECREEEPPRD